MSPDAQSVRSHFEKNLRALKKIIARAAERCDENAAQAPFILRGQSSSFLILDVGLAGFEPAVSPSRMTEMHFPLMLSARCQTTAGSAVRQGTGYYET